MNILSKPPLGLKQPKERGTPKERAYYAWLHDDPLCCLTGQTYGIEIAHTGPKDALGRKAPLATCLPIIGALHGFEESNRCAFWVGVGFPDHIEWAIRLMDMFETGQRKEVVLDEMIAMANRDYIAGLLSPAEHLL